MVVLLIDSCSDQGLLKRLPPLSTKTVKDLPPNITSKIQLCDAGIIAAMEANYRLFKMERAIYLAEPFAKNIQSVNIFPSCGRSKKEKLWIWR